MEPRIERRHQDGLEGLTPRERTVFELRHYEGMRLRAIGDMLGTTEEAAKNCLFRATQKMRASLESVCMNCDEVVEQISVLQLRGSFAGSGRAD